MTRREPRLPWMSAAGAAALVALYPGWVRRRYGAEMRECHAAACLEAAADRGGKAGIGFHARTLARLAANATVAWFDTPAFLAGRAWRRADGSWSEGSVHAGRRTSMANFSDTLVHSLRGLQRSPRFTAMTLVTLSLGIGATATVFAAVNGVLLSALPYPAADRLVTVYERSPAPDFGREWVAEETLRDWQQRTHRFQAIAAWRLALATFSADGHPERLSGYAVTSTYFDVMGIPMTLGRGFRAAEDRPGGEPVVVLSHALWLRRFHGDLQVVGRTVTVNRVAHTVVGVAGARLEYPERSEFWVPLALEFKPGYRSFRYLAVVAQLAPGVSLDGAGADLSRVSAAIGREAPDSNAGWTAGVESLATDVVGDLRPFLIAGFIAVVLLLVVAVVNVVNLFVERMTARQEEFAVRRALGASPACLLHLFLTEAFVLCAASGIGGWLMAWWGSRALAVGLQRWLPGSVSIGMDGRAALFAAAVSLMVGLILGWLPAWLAPRAPISEGLRAGTRSVVGHRRVQHLRTGLLSVQVAVVVALLVGATLFVRSLDYLRGVDPGFDPNHVVTFDVDLPEEEYDTARRVAAIDRLRAGIAILPGVESVGSVFPMPMVLGSVPLGLSTPEMKAWPEDRRPSAHSRIVSPGYFETMRIPLVRGRYLQDSDRLGRPPVVVVNQTLARLAFGGRDPIGQVITFQDPSAADAKWMTVVGVVGDVLFHRLWSQRRPEVYRSALQDPFPTTRFVVRTGVPFARLGDRLRATVHDVDPNIALGDVRSASDIVAAGVTLPRLTTALLTVFAAVSALLALVGVQGALALAVTRRVREMGVRMALGASPARVLRDVLRMGMRPVVAGSAVGLAVAAVASELLAAQIHGVGPRDPWSFAVAGSGFILLSALVCLGPAARAMRVHPGRVLKGE